MPRKPGLALVPLAGLLGLAATQPVQAQYYNTVGRGDPSVIVDTSVLDQLGPPPNIGIVPPPDGLTKTPGASRYPTATGPRSGVGAGTPDKPPVSRLVAVPAMPGKPVPKLSGGSTSPTSSAAPPRPAPVAAPAAPPPSPPPAVAATPPRPSAPPPSPPVAAAPPPPPPAPPPAPAATHTANTTPAPAPLAAPPAPPAPPPVVAAPPAPPAAPPSPPPAPPPVVATAPVPPPMVNPAPPAPSPVATANPQPTMPAPAAMPSPAPAPAPQVATAPPVVPGSGAGRLLFDGGSATLSDAARQTLDGLATQLAGNEQRLKVVAYAAGQANNASQARRLSLSRALAVRSYLIDKGIRSTRIDVQAMGAPENGNGGPADRVDLSLATQ